MTDSSARVLDARLLLSIIAAGIMSFSGVVVETAMNVTFPTLMHEFNIGTSLVQWITTGYLLVLALIIPTSAYLKRRFSTRSLFTAAISSFLAGTLLAAWSPYFNVLLIGRLLQGIGFAQYTCADVGDILLSAIKGYTRRNSCGDKHRTYDERKCGSVIRRSFLFHFCQFLCC